MVQLLAPVLPWKPLPHLMVNLKERSPKKELLDADNNPFEDIKKNMEELETVNKYLGGHAITKRGLQHFLKENSTLLVCEIGCGGGDNLQALQNYALQKKSTLHFIGIDIKDFVIKYAAEKQHHLNADWIVSDYKAVKFKENKPDVIFSSLFCHHFTNEELVEMLQWMQQNSSKGFFINDLQRNTIAYYAIKFITGIFSKSYLVKNDAPLSVARSFTKKDWQEIFLQAGIKNYTLRWQWAFRFLIICKN